ncbi:hypothetical protein Hanom_Chr08g00682181 [Helianthus anomalus]
MQIRSVNKQSNPKDKLNMYPNGLEDEKECMRSYNLCETRYLLLAWRKPKIKN